MIKSLSDKYEWSKSSINKLGDAVRDGEPYDEERYAEWFLWHAQTIVVASQAVGPVLKRITREYCDQSRYFYQFEDKHHLTLSSRVKTQDTTRQKLRRQKENRNATPLARIQDIAGLRVDGTFTLEGQDLVADEIRIALLNVGATEVRVKDIREQPHSGYRGVHLHVMAPAGRLEVQVRTMHQSHWANLYEVISDLIGRDIRYSEDADGKRGKILRELWKQSDDSYRLEKLWMATARIDSHPIPWTDKAVLPAEGREKAEVLQEHIEQLRVALAEHLTAQKQYFIDARGSMEELRDHHITLGET